MGEQEPGKELSSEECPPTGTKWKIFWQDLLYTLNTLFRMGFEASRIEKVNSAGGNTKETPFLKALPCATARKAPISLGGKILPHLLPLKQVACSWWPLNPTFKERGMTSSPFYSQHLIWSYWKIFSAHFHNWKASQKELFTHTSDKRQVNKHTTTKSDNTSHK